MKMLVTLSGDLTEHQDPSLTRLRRYLDSDAYGFFDYELKYVDKHIALTLLRFTPAFYRKTKAKAKFTNLPSMTDMFTELRYQADREIRIFVRTLDPKLKIDRLGPTVKVSNSTNSFFYREINRLIAPSLRQSRLYASHKDGPPGYWTTRKPD